MRGFCQSRGATSRTVEVVRLRARLLGRSALGTSCQEAAPGQAQETPEKVLRANTTVLTEGLEEVMEVWVSLLQLLQLQPDLDGKKMDEGVNDSRAGPRTLMGRMRRCGSVFRFISIC